MRPDPREGRRALWYSKWARVKIKYGCSQAVCQQIGNCCTVIKSIELCCFYRSHHLPLTDWYVSSINILFPLWKALLSILVTGKVRHKWGAIKLYWIKASLVYKNGLFVHTLCWWKSSISVRCFFQPAFLYSNLERDSSVRWFLS